MIYDKISNINTYFGISEDIRIGLCYLREVKIDVEVGVYVLSPHVKAVVSEYMTKREIEYGYEAHRKFVDIQYLIKGTEKVCYLPLEYLKETKCYSEEMDAAFFKDANIKSQELLLGNDYFAIFFPQDGHMPQLSVYEPEHVKKVVIKVKLV